ncbi:MAG: hypothetical protein ABI690_28220 [Chloroflexota bacterium]
MPDNLVVAWIEAGNLFARTGNAPSVQLIISGDALTPYLSPNGRQVAYLHGDTGLAAELSLVDLSGGKIHDLVTAKTLSADANDSLLMSQVAWLDDSNLYFNTAQNTSFGEDRHDDLWRVDAQTGEVAMLLPAGEGGAFSISPDRKWLAVTSAGTYNHEDAHLRLMNAETHKVQEILSFPAISTGSEYSFYPQIFWAADSSVFRVAIPDKDLIYDEVSSPPVVLWQVGIDGSSEKIGSISASFFGLPCWSDNGLHLAYLHRSGALADNQFDLFLAARNGDNPVKYASGKAGAIGFPTWIPKSAQFIFAQGEPGAYWLGDTASPPAPIDEPMFIPAILEDGQIVYVSGADSPSELRYMHLADNQPLSIAAVEHPFPAFDAVIAR